MVQIPTGVLANVCGAIKAKDAKPTRTLCEESNAILTLRQAEADDTHDTIHIRLRMHSVRKLSRPRSPLPPGLYLYP